MLAFKLIFVPLLIGAISLAGRRWGPTVSGWLTGLPLTSGPIVFFLAVEQGSRFASRSAQSCLLGMISLSFFCLAYSLVARNRNWWFSVVAGWTAFFVLTVLLEKWPFSLLVTFVATILVLIGIFKVLPESTGTSVLKTPPPWEIPLRMGVATGMLLLITGLAGFLGPRLSGLLTPFPVVSSVLAVFIHYYEGGRSVNCLLRGLMAGLFTFTVFFLVIAATIQSWGVVQSFVVASLAGLAAHGCSLWAIRDQISQGRVVLKEEDL